MRYGIRRCLIFFVIALLCVASIYAIYDFSRQKHEVDLFRTDQVTAAQLSRKFKKEIAQISDIMTSADSWRSETNQKKHKSLHVQIEQEIKNMGSFSYVRATSIFYPGKNVNHMTIDVVDSKDKHRLEYFLPNSVGDIADPDFLIKHQKEYVDIATDIVFQEKRSLSLKNCPAHHCIYGFDHPRIKKYEKMFNIFVPKNKKQLIEILQKDKNENKRARAVLLLAHINDGKELVEIITPFIRDSSSAVRNNVMRVLGSTLENVDVDDFPVDEAILALDFPVATDRNKALYILLSLAKTPKYAKYIAQHAGPQLIVQLKMQQPNLHDTAYSVLKRISGKDYGERDYLAWQKWLSQDAK